MNSPRSSDLLQSTPELAVVVVDGGWWSSKTTMKELLDTYLRGYQGGWLKGHHSKPWILARICAIHAIPQIIMFNQR